MNGIQMKLIKTKRIYEKASNNDGFRILVDRLWPRGMSKSLARVDLWLKDIAPSNKTRKSFSHDQDKWVEFKKNYNNELRDRKELVARLSDLEREKGTITLLYSAKDTEHNNAVFLKEYLQKNNGHTKSR